MRRLPKEAREFIMEGAMFGGAMLAFFFMIFSILGFFGSLVAMLCGGLEYWRLTVVSIVVLVLSSAVFMRIMK